MDLSELPTRKEVVKDIISRWQWSAKKQTVPIDKAHGFVLAEDVRSRNTLPVCRSAECDGISVRYEDFKEGIPDTKNWRKEVDYAAADTGDDFPDAFDTVIQIEDLTFLSPDVFQLDPNLDIRQGQLVSGKGSLLEEGELLIEKGSVLTPIRLNLLASGGYDALPVYAPPIIAYIPTGNELVPPGKIPGRGQNIESNGVMLRSMIDYLGGKVITYPICQDILAELRVTIQEATEKADIILINGGSSKGSEDYNGKIIQEFSSYWHQGVRSIPGIPVSVGIINGKPVINVPGPPFAAFSVMDWCVRPLIRHWLNISENELTHKILVTLTKKVEKPEGFDFYLRLHITEKEGGYQAEPLLRDSRHAHAMGCCNGYYIIPHGKKTVEVGEMIRAELIC